MSDRKATIKKISALLNHAQGTDNAVEAETFMAKVNELLTAYNISMVELGDYDDDPVVKSTEDLTVARSMSYAPKLVTMIGKYYGCRVTFIRTKNHTYFTAYGRESAVVTFNMMVPFILKQVRQAARKLSNEINITYGKALTAVGNGLSYRLHVLIVEQRRRDEERHASGKNALVPVDLIDLKVKEHHPGLKTAKGKSGPATVDGVRAADGISLNLQTTNKENTRRLV